MPVHLSGTYRRCALRLSGKPIEAFAVLADQDAYVAGGAKRIVENTTMAGELCEIGANW